MKKLKLFLIAVLPLLMFGPKPGYADPIGPSVSLNGNSVPAPTPPPLSSITDQFSASFLSHISAVDDFRQDGSHVIKFTDGIFQQIPFQGDHLLVESFGLIPSRTDSTKFEKSYSIHAHLISVIGKYLGINPTYAPILNDIELTPGYTYDTDVSHGQFDFSVGYSHKFGGQ